MARETLVLDASVGVKWFSGVGERHVPQSRALLAAHAMGNICLAVPDIFFHEVFNALVHKKSLPVDIVEDSITQVFDLGLTVFVADRHRLRSAVQIARQAGITEYDAIYAAVAIEAGCPLVTANPRHQGRVLACRVIPIEEWNGAAQGDSEG